MRRSDAIAFRRSIVASTLVHIAGIALLWFAASQVEDLPAMRVYAVDIVSPPPQLAGPPDPGGGGTPAVVEDEPEPEPEPEPPAVEEPEPAPPVAEAPPRREPSTPAPATRTPEPETPTPPRTEPAEREAPVATRSGGGTGEGTGASQGANPDPESAGGENLDIHLRGVQCPSPAYCANIVRQLYRYFRPPTGSSTDAVEIFFWINKDGSATDLRVVRTVGSYRFQVAALEAVEQAGNNKAFGPLPGSFQLDRLPVSFYFRPAR